MHRLKTYARPPQNCCLLAISCISLKRELAQVLALVYASCAPRHACVLLSVAAWNSPEPWFRRPISLHASLFLRISQCHTGKRLQRPFRHAQHPHVHGPCGCMHGAPQSE